MKIGREFELECPRCHLVAIRRPGRQTDCTHCGAELVVAPGPSEDWVRAHLYGGHGLQVRPTDARPAAAR